MTRAEKNITFMTEIHFAHSGSSRQAHFVEIRDNTKVTMNSKILKRLIFQLAGSRPAGYVQAHPGS